MVKTYRTLYCTKAFFKCHPKDKIGKTKMFLWEKTEAIRGDRLKDKGRYARLGNRDIFRCEHTNEMKTYCPTMGQLGLRFVITMLLTRVGYC